MQSLRFVANFFSVVLLVIAILDYTMIYNQYKAIQKKIDLLDNANSQLLDIMNAVTRVRDLSLLGSSVYPTSQLNEGQLRDSLQVALDSAKILKEALEDQLDDGLSDAHLTLLSEPVVHLTASDGSITSKGLTQSLESVISLGYQLDSKQLSNLTQTDSDVFFFVFNSLNNLGLAMKKNSEYYAMELNEKITSKDGTFLLLLIASILTILITMVFLYPIFFTIEKLRNEILCLFLDIPNRTVKTLYNKCETFLSNLQIGEEDDMLSEIEEPELDKTQDDMNITTIIQKKKRRKYKNSGKGYQMFIIQFGIIIAISEAYFLFSFISTTLHTNNTKTLASEFNLTSSAEPFYTYVNTAERQLFWNSSTTIVNKDPYLVAQSNMKSAFNLYTQMIEVHETNRDLHTDEYMTAFNQIMLDDPCVSLGKSVDQTDCQTFAALAVYKGMTVAIARQLENLRTLLRCYANYTNGYTCSVLDLPTNISVSGVTTKQNTILSMMATSQAQEINKMDRIYIQGSLRLLIDAYIDSFDERFNSSLTTRLVVFIIFIVALIVVYGAIWQPTIQKINNDIWRTKLMLGMIPLSVIAKIKSIKSYIKRINTNRDITAV